MPTPIESEHTKAKTLARLFSDDTRFALGRIAVFQYLSVAIFLILISGFWILQVRDNAESDANRGGTDHRARLVAERDGVCRDLLGGATSTASSGGPTRTLQ